MVSFTSILALVAAAGVHSAVAAPVAEPAVEMAVGRDALNIMEDRAFTEFQEREVINCKITNVSLTLLATRDASVPLPLIA